jgi:hypothetical protein
MADPWDMTSLQLPPRLLPIFPFQPATAITR